MMQFLIDDNDLVDIAPVTETIFPVNKISGKGINYTNKPAFWRELSDYTHIRDGDII